MAQIDFLSRMQSNLSSLVPDDGTGILVALSGGPDSVATLLGAHHWAQQTKRPVAAAHLNHQMRGADADADTEFCRDLCHRLGIPFYTEAADPRALSRQRGHGLEEAGRHLRRQFCEGILASDDKMDWIATGHHRDDQVETVLMRLFRGTGTEGMRGILPRDGRWLHPLLEFERTEILRFLEASGQPWRTDSSNISGDNQRARLRRELLPLAREIFGAGCEQGPARLASLWNDDAELLIELTSQWLADCRTEAGDLRVKTLLKLDLPKARRVLRTWLAGYCVADLERVHLENIIQWLRVGTSGSTMDLPGEVVLQRDFDQLKCLGDATSGPELRVAADYRISIDQNDEPEPDQGIGELSDEATWLLSCPAAALKGRVRVRNWRTGDRCRPLGLQGTKKLSDLFREHRLSKSARPGALVVCDDEGILWVVGLVRDERTRMLPSSPQRVTISVVRRNGDSTMTELDPTREDYR